MRTGRGQTGGGFGPGSSCLLPPPTQINKVAKAVAAAHTFFVANPEHVEMKQNLEYYQMMAGVKEADFIDLEARPHMVSTPSTGFIHRG